MTHTPHTYKSKTRIIAIIIQLKDKKNVTFSLNLKVIISDPMDYSYNLVAPIFSYVLEFYIILQR